MTRPWGWRWRSARLARLVPVHAADALRGDLLEDFAEMAQRVGRWRAEAWLAVEMSSIGRAYKRERASTTAADGPRLPRLGGSVAHAWRSLRRSPWYAATAIGVIAVSIALSTTVFAIVDGTLFKPLPYPDSGRIYAVDLAYSKLAEPFWMLPFVSEATFVEWRDAVPDVAMTAYNLSGDHMVGTHDSVRTARVDARFFDVFEQRPIVGGFAPEDFRAPQPIPPALVSYMFWQRRLGGSRAAIGRILTDETGDGIRVVGVLPDGFLFPYPTGTPSQPEILLPRISTPTPGRGGSLAVALRLPREASATDVGNRLTAAFVRQVAARRSITPPPTTSARLRVIMGGFDRLRLDPIRDALMNGVKPGAEAAFAAAIALLILACLNVAGLTSARVRDRERELSVRRALGARLTDLVGLLAIESAVIVSAGTFVGMLGAQLCLARLTPFLTSFIKVVNAPAIDARAVASGAIAALAGTALVTLLATRAVARASLRQSMSEGGGSTDRERRRWSIVSIELALGAVIVIGGALVCGSLIRAWAEDPGFDRQDTALLSVRTPLTAPAGDVETFVSDIARLPGVLAAGGASHGVLDPSFNGSEFTRPAGIPLSTDPFPIESIPVTHGFFTAAGLALIDGRLPTDAEFESNASVIAVSEMTAREFWPSERAVGQPLARHGRTYTVVGVVRDARFMSLDLDAQGVIYWPVGGADRHFISRLFVRFGHADAQSLASVTQHILASCPGCWLYGAQMLRDALSTTIRGREFSAILFASFGVSALAIVGAGVLGVVAMTTNRRTREIGIRMALGATRTAVVQQIVREQLAPVALGLLVGGVAAAWATRFVESYLYKTPTYDPRAWSVAIIVLLIVALTGAFVPSQRASRIDPVRALRVD